MPQSSVTFRPPFRDILGRFARADKQLLENKRKAVRLLGRRWVELAKEEAPEGKTGKFRESIRFQTFVKDKEVGFTSSAVQPLGKWIVGGTRRHRIYPRNKGSLYFFWGKVGMYTVVPKEGSGIFARHGHGFTGKAYGKFWVGKGYVNHPGTKPNDYIERTYDRWVDEMGNEIDKVADKFVIDLVAK